MKKAAKKEKTINTTLPLYDVNGKVVGEVKLDEKLFDGKVNRTLLYEVNKMYEANKRQGTAATKTRAFVAGGGIKPWRQKGTGRARVGSIRSPLWRHGGIA
ncbi:MAG TPA: 50S ribosomal protein L4, partial [Candidatus Omnitrophota bacterium]|nr:50S ribosomal protein L4 [Candidatus Omnitrophota bacterium]